MAKITVNGLSFPSKAALWEHCQAILHAATVGLLLEGAEGALLKALVDRHPHVEELVGPGIQGVFVGVDFYGGRNFQVRRLDGTPVPFAYRKTIYDVDPQKDARQRVRTAFRAAVRDQTLAVKAQAKGTTCPLSGRVLTYETTDIDHVGTPFKELLAGFLAAESLTIDQVAVIEGYGTFSLADTHLMQRFQQWHQDKAQLQAIHRDAHRTKEGHQARPLEQTFLRGSGRVHAPAPAPVEDLDAFLESLG